MASGIFFEFEASHQAVINLLVLEAILVLPLARVSWLKLQEQGAKIRAFEPISLQQRWLCMASGMCFQFDARHHIAADSLVLGAILVLPLARVSRLKLKKQGARIVLPSCACHLAHLSIDLYSKGSSARITTLGSLPASRL